MTSRREFLYSVSAMAATSFIEPVANSATKSYGIAYTSSPSGCARRAKRLAVQAIKARRSRRKNSSTSARASAGTDARWIFRNWLRPTPSI